MKEVMARYCFPPNSTKQGTNYQPVQGNEADAQQRDPDVPVSQERYELTQYSPVGPRPRPEA